MQTIQINSSSFSRILQNRSVAACTQPARIFPSQSKTVASPFWCFR